MGRTRGRQVWRWAALALLALAPGRAEANTGIFFILGLTPLEWGLAYLIALVPMEAACVKAVAGCSYRRALTVTFVANLVSGFALLLVTGLPFILVLIMPLLGLLGALGLNPYHPVVRLFASMLVYFALSCVLEVLLLKRATTTRPWRAALVANGLSYVIGTLLLLFSPAPYAKSTEWQAMYTRWDLQAALKAYLAAHGGQPPASERTNAALYPYLQTDPPPLWDGQRLVYWDRLRWPGTEPELRVVVKQDGQGAWRVELPDAEAVTRRSPRPWLPGTLGPLEVATPVKP